MGRWKWTPEGATESILIEGADKQDALRRYQEQQQAGPSAPGSDLPSVDPPPEHPTVPPIQPMPMERPPPQDPQLPIGARAPTDVATDEEGRVLTQPFQQQAHREQYPIGIFPEVGRQGVSQVTGIGLGGTTKWDPVQLALNALAVVAPPVRGAKAVNPVLRGVQKLASTKTGRIGTGAAAGGAGEVVESIQKGEPLSTAVEEATGGIVGGALKTGVGEALAGGAHLTARMLGAGKVREKVKENVYKALEDAAPWITKRTRGGVVTHTPIKTDQDAYDIFIAGNGQQALRENFGREIVACREVGRQSNHCRPIACHEKPSRGWCAFIGRCH